MSMYFETMNTQACMGLVQSWPIISGASSRTLNSKPMGDHSRGTHQLPHLTSAKNPCFYQKIVTQSHVFSTLSKILETVYSKTPNRLEKGTQMPPIFMAFVTERPPICCLACKCLRGMLLPQTRSEAGKFCILETELCNLVNTFRFKFNKGDENKFQFYRLNRPNCYGRTSLEGRDDTQVIIPWSNMEGDISYTILCMILHLLVL